MASIIAAGTTSGSALNMTGDTSGQLQLATNGSTTALTIDTSQNVGIGTTSPTAPLSFAASAGTAGNANKIRFYDGGGGAVYGIGISAAQLNYLSGDSAAHVFYNGGATPIERMRIDGSGNVLVTGSGGIGYGTGSGGTVTQLTSKTTGVTINKSSGRIITSNSALAANTTTAFIVTNSACSATDTIIVNVWESGLSLQTYTVWANPGNTNGYFYIQLRNMTGSSYSEAVYINFCIIKGSTS